MEDLFLNQASILGRTFEIGVQRGVLANLIHQGILDPQYSALTPWKAAKNADVYTALIRALDLTDPNAQEWAKSVVRHLLVLGYGLGWTAMRECLKRIPVRKPLVMEAIWCPLTLPGDETDREEEREATAQAFQTAFQLPGVPDIAWVRRGQPARADFLLWVSTGHQKTRQSAVGLMRDEREKRLSQRKKDKPQKFNHAILCLEFSYNAPPQLADFRVEDAHRQEINRYARYIDSRGVFSRVCAEVDGAGFELSSNLANHLSVFSGSDKPLFKLCQASSYTERLIRLLGSTGRLQDTCSARAIAVTSNGFESLAAHFVGIEPEPDPRARLMKSLGEAYRKLHQSDAAAREARNSEITLVFNRLVRSLPRDFKQQALQIAAPPSVNGRLQYLFHETVDAFHNPMGLVSCDVALDAVEDTEDLSEFFGGSPRTQISDVFAQQHPQDNQLPLRQIHAAAVIAGLQAAQSGRLNLIALEGNPGIGKTTAVTQFLKQQTDGYLFLYLSPRVVINRDVTTKLARNNGAASGILTITTNSKLITSAPKWYEQQVVKQGWARRPVDSAVVVDGVAGLQKPICSTVFVSPEEEHDIDCNVVASTRFKQTRSDREDSVQSTNRPGVLRTLASSARRLLEANTRINRLVLTGAIQGYRSTEKKTTISALDHLFTKKPDTVPGRHERQAFSQRIPTIIVMVDELAGDGAGAVFAHGLAEWLHQQFIAPFEGTQSPFRVILILSDASLSNEVVLNSYLNSGERAPDKVLVSPSQGDAPFRVTGTQTKVGTRKHPTLHIMTNSYPASALAIDYSIRLAPITVGLAPDGKKQGIRQAIREQAEDELLNNAYSEIQRGLERNAEQLIFFAQDKAFLRQLRKKLIAEPDALLASHEVAVLDQSVLEKDRLALVQEPRRDQVRVFLMTSSGARGVSFPKTDWIIAWIPRFNIEAALMEVAQLIYRGRGTYTDPETGTQISGDDRSRQLVMLINDFVVADEDPDRARLWLRQASDLLTLLVMLRSTIYTRIKGDAGLRRQRIAFVPVGFIGDEELLNLMSDDVQNFLREAQVFRCDEHEEHAKAIVIKAAQLVSKIFSQFKLRGQARDAQTKSYANYQTLEALVKAVSRSSSSLLPTLDNDALVIPDHLQCLGPYWMEDWGDRQIEEKFNFEGWRAKVQADLSKLLGLLNQIHENTAIPPKLRRPAKELHMLLIREKEQSNHEYTTLQALKTNLLMLSLPLDYPHFWLNPRNLEDEQYQQVLEDPGMWRNALGRALTPQGMTMPVISQYEAFPWAAMAGTRISTQLDPIFDDRYFMASSELNLLNTILLEDEEQVTRAIE